MISCARYNVRDSLNTHRFLKRQLGLHRGKLVLIILKMCALMKWAWIIFFTSQGLLCDAEEDVINRENSSMPSFFCSLP